MIFRFVGAAALIAKAADGISQAVTDSANDLVGQAQDRTPVDTGTLKASIHTDGAQGSGLGFTATVQTGGESGDYALFVHEGTVHMAGRPFLSSALLDNAAIYQAAIAAAAGKGF